MENDLEQYWQQGGTYVVPVEVINYWCGEVEDLQQENKQLENNWNELKKWLEELDKTFCETMTRDNSEFYHFQRGELMFLRNIKLKMRELENKQCHTTSE